jgi:hypothetical protein
MNKRKILVSITTITKKEGLDWQAKIKEINELGITEVALFPTCLNGEKRKILYDLLEKSCIKSIPLVHIRNSMTPEELEYLVSNYGTKIFNTHTGVERPMAHDYSKYKKIISFENTCHAFDEEEIKNFGGICLDFSHLENDRLSQKERFEKSVKVLEKYTPVCNHVAPVKKNNHWETGIKEMRYDEHWLGDLSELDYLKRYPLRYFSPLIALEMENSIKEQLKAKEYVEKLIKDKESSGS